MPELPELPEVKRAATHLGGAIFKTDGPGAQKSLEIEIFDSTQGPFLRLRGKEKDNVMVYLDDWELVNKKVVELIGKRRLIKSVE